MKKVLFAFLICAASLNLSAQKIIYNYQTFLTTSPNARGAALGHTGVATEPDANSIFWNAAKQNFSIDEKGISASFVQPELYVDGHLYNMSAFYKLNPSLVVQGSFRYSSEDKVTGRNMIGAPLNQYQYAVDISAAYKITPNFSTGITLKHIQSNININYRENLSHGSAFAGDLSCYWQDSLNIGGKDSKLAFGLNISDLGNKIRYDSITQAFLPMNLRLGASYKVTLSDKHSIALSSDVNKGLIPSTPMYDYTGQYILRGKDPNRSVLNSIFTSFADSPEGFKGEAKEIFFSSGIEYVYNQHMAIRGGYHYEYYQNYNTFVSTGIGLMYKKVGLDITYTTNESLLMSLNLTI